MRAPEGLPASLSQCVLARIFLKHGAVGTYGTLSA